MKKVKFNDNWICGSAKFSMYEIADLTAEQYETGKDLKTSYNANVPLFVIVDNAKADKV